MTEQRAAPESAAGKISDETVAEIVERILGVCLPERVILFGSAATRRMTRDSDIDILRSPEHRGGRTPGSDARADCACRFTVPL